MTKELKTLYSVFDLLNGEEITYSPCMCNPKTYNFTQLLRMLQDTIDKKHTLTINDITHIKELLMDTHNQYYQPSKIREPIRIQNCPYIQICNQLMEEIEDVE